MENDELKALVSDDDINKAWGNADFGERQTKREHVNDDVLKVASGYCTGYTAFQICMELGLVEIATKRRLRRLTKKGKRYLYWSHCTRHVEPVSNPYKLPIEGTDEALRDFEDALTTKTNENDEVRHYFYDGAIDTIRKALEAQLVEASGNVDDWQDISTAPMVRQCLVFNGYQHIAINYKGNGWMIDDGGGESSLNPEPTHWKELSDPPKE